jgi:hypothetical protein
VSTLFVIVMIAPTLVDLYGNGSASLIAAYVFFILYAGCMAFSVSSEGRIAHLPMISVCIATAASILLTSAPKNAARKINIGNFNTNITVDEKGYAALSTIDGLKIRQTSGQTYFVSDVFVLLELPNKLIISKSSERQQIVSLSSNSVIGSTQIKNLPKK